MCYVQPEGGPIRGRQVWLAAVRSLKFEFMPFSSGELQEFVSATILVVAYLTCSLS